MNDPGSQDDLRRMAREIGQELARTMEQAGRLFREAVKDWSGTSPTPGPRPSGPGADAPGAAGDATSAESPLDTIRRLGELRDAGYVTQEEFEAKKAELLGRIR